MIKKALLLFSCFILIFVMTACGSTTNNNGSETPKKSETPAVKPAEKVVLNYWTDDRHDADYIQETVDQFNAEHADSIEVKITVMSENYNQAVDISFASNQPPDVMRVKAGNTTQFTKKGFLEPIDSYMTDDMKEKFAGVEGVNVFDGKQYSMPSTGTTIRLIYNKDLFDKADIKNPPTTLQEMVDAAKKITEVGKSDGQYGFALPFKNPGSAFQRSMRAILPVSGAHYDGFDLKSGKFDFTRYGEAVEYFKQMLDDGSMLPGSESLDIDPLRAQFAEGKIGMYMSYASEPGVYSTQFPTKINWDVAPVPSINGEKDGVSAVLGAGVWLGMSAKSEHKDAVWTFMEYMYSDDILQTYHEQGLGLVVLPHIVEKAAKSELYGVEGFQIMDREAIWPISPSVTPEGKNAFDAFFEYMLVGGDLNAIVNNLNKSYNAALEKAVSNGTVTVNPMPDFTPESLLK
jgi:multiple sugar transport system substrate-binding protein